MWSQKFWKSCLNFQSVDFGILQSKLYQVRRQAYTFVKKQTVTLFHFYWQYQIRIVDKKQGKYFFKFGLNVSVWHLNCFLTLWILSSYLDIESSFVANIMKLNNVWRKWFSNIFLCLDSEVFIDPEWEFPCQEKMLKVYDLSYSCI